jgi:hypothetical protein
LRWYHLGMSELRELVPSRHLAELLKVPDAIEFVLFDTNRLNELSTGELHRLSAVSTVAVVAKRMYRRSLWSITQDRDKVSGHPISLNEFLGPYFDHTNQQLRLNTKEINLLPVQPASGAKDGHTCGAFTPPQFETYGYADSFFKTPHGLRASNDEIQSTFAEISGFLFGQFAVPLEIYTWSTDWSNYFDPGHEWWGAFLWTVHNREQHLMIGLAASATD